MSESEIQQICDQLQRLGCTEIVANGVTSSDELVLLQCDEEKSLLPIGAVHNLLKDLQVPENAPPDRFVWYMIDDKLQMLNQQN